MKRKNIVSLIAIVAIVAVAMSAGCNGPQPSPPSPPKSPTASLKISTTPVQGDILLNGVYKGQGFWQGDVRTGYYEISFGDVPSEERKKYSCEVEWSCQWDYDLGESVCGYETVCKDRWVTISYATPAHISVNLYEGENKEIIGEYKEI